MTEILLAHPVVQMVLAAVEFVVRPLHHKLDVLLTELSSNLHQVKLPVDWKLEILLPSMKAVTSLILLQNQVSVI